MILNGKNSGKQYIYNQLSLNFYFGTYYIFKRRRREVMSEENKNRNKDKGKQKNIARKYDTSPKQDHSTEIAEESEFVNIQGKKNKRKR